MTAQRIYVPSTLPGLAAVVTAGGIGPAPVRAHAVTDALLEAYADGGPEEWEYAALSAAAQESIGLLGPDDPPRRVVVVAEVDGVQPDPDDELTAVQTYDAVPVSRIVAVHVDDAGADEDVRAAREAWEAAAAGDEEAARLVESCLRHEPGWYATQEIPDLLGS